MHEPIRDIGRGPEGNAIRISRRELLALSALGLVAGAPSLAGAGGPAGQLTWGVHVSLAPTWFDPAETSGIITPYMMLYALHDAVVKPMPGKLLVPSLAESWSAGKDGLGYDFLLRENIRFHNGDPVVGEDVKFSFERYRGASHQMMRSRVASVEVLDRRRVRFTLKDPWPDFLTFYGGEATLPLLPPRSPTACAPSRCPQGPPPDAGSPLEPQAQLGHRPPRPPGPRQ
jgi:peptide/nickel transport system substrate-binding protein